MCVQIRDTDAPGWGHMKNRQIGVTTPPAGQWVQTDRAAHEAWAQLAVANPRAASVLHVIVASMGRHNALVASRATLARACGCSVATLKRAVNVLKEGQWIDVRQIGPGTANAYIVNSRVAWTGKREGIRHALFDARVLITDQEQPDRAELDTQAELRALPALQPGERQLPSGPGQEPPSQPTLPSMEPDLPALGHDAPPQPLRNRSDETE